MKFEDVKVGQKVKLVSGKVGEKYEFTNSFTQSMMGFIGEEFTVGSVDKAGVYFGVGDDLYGFPWECLEPVEEEKKTKYRST